MPCNYCPFPFLPPPFVYQIAFITNDSLPSDLSPALLLHMTELRRLQERIKQLRVEKNEHRDLHCQDRQQLVRLTYDHKDMGTKIQGKIHTGQNLILEELELPSSLT